MPTDSSIGLADITAASATVANFISLFSKYEAGMYRLYSEYLGLDNPIVRALVSDGRWDAALTTLKRVMLAKNASVAAMEALKLIREGDRIVRGYRNLCAHYPFHFEGNDTADLAIVFEGDINPTNRNPEPWEYVKMSAFKDIENALISLLMMVDYHLKPLLLGNASIWEAELKPDTLPWIGLPALRRANH